MQRAEGRWSRQDISGIPSSDQEIRLVVRQHVAALGAPVLRTALGLLALLSGLPLLLLLLFAAAAALETRRRLLARARTCAAVGVATAVLLVVFAGPASPLAGRVLIGVLLLAWVGFEVADWHHDRLVVTTKRLYRCSGIFVRHVPSMSLTGIAFIDAAASPLGRAVGYGTILLDSVAQRDQPLSRFSFIPQVQDVHSQILELRAAAIPKYPPIY